MEYLKLTNNNFSKVIDSFRFTEHAIAWFNGISDGVTFLRIHTAKSNLSFLIFNFTFLSFTKCLKQVRKWSSFLLENSASKIQWKTQQIQSTSKPKYESIKSQNIQHNSKIQSNNAKVNYKHKFKIEKREEKERKLSQKCAWISRSQTRHRFLAVFTSPSFSLKLLLN